MGEKLITRNQLADSGNLTPTTIYMWTKRESDPLPCTYIGRSVRYKPSKVEEGRKRQKPVKEGN